jgi:hypothetical protein
MSNTGIPYIDYVIWKFFDCLNPLIFIEGTNE